MKFVKNHKYTIIIVLIFILLFCLGLKVKDILIPDDEKASYGNRLENIEDYPLEKSLFTKINEEMVKDKIKGLTHRIQGKIVNFTMTVADDVSINDAKSYGTKIVAYFSEEELSYYTIQIYIKKDDAALNNFPIIGAKNPNKKEISWTQNREITKEEEDTNED